MSRSGLQMFLIIAEKHPEQLYRYGMDFFRQREEGHVLAWEQREKGSLAAIMNAYDYALPKIFNQECFTLKDLLQLSSIACQQVGSMNNFGGRLTGIRQGNDHCNVDFGIFFDTSTDAGLLEMAKYCNAHYDEQAGYYMLKLDRLKSTIDFSNFSWRPHEQVSDEALRDMIAEQLREKEVIRFCGVCAEEKGTNKISRLLEEELISLYQKLSETEDSEAKKEFIVGAIQNMVRIHPFYDGNGRIFCTVLLNALLMQHGFSPAILENPNKFNGYAVSELCEMVSQGIQLTESLADLSSGEQLLDVKESGVTLEEQKNFSIHLIRSLLAMKPEMESSFDAKPSTP